MGKQEVSSLYLLKGIGAFLVVVCHVPLFWVRDNLEIITSLAVPLFFAISGYLLYAPSYKDSMKKALKSAKKVVIILCVVNFIHWLTLLPSYGNVMDSIEKVIEFLLLGNTFSGHLWYLTAMVEALLLIALVLKVGKGRGIEILPFMLILNWLCGRYSFVLDIHTNIYTALHYAVPFISIGYILAKYEKEVVLKFNNIKMGGVIGVISIIEYLLYNYYGLKGNGGIFLTAPLLLSSIMCLAMANKKMGDSTWLVHVGKYYSASIYYFHILVAVCLTKLFVFWGYLQIYSLFGSILVFMATIVVAVCLRTVQSKMRVQIL